MQGCTGLPEGQISRLLGYDKSPEDGQSIVGPNLLIARDPLRVSCWTSRRE